jgi:hypothetical protein
LITFQEYGAHDIVPGVGGEPRGYLEFAKADGDKAYIKWTIQAVSCSPSTCYAVNFAALRERGSSRLIPRPRRIGRRRDN